jgi:hypothetical protein
MDVWCVVRDWNGNPNPKWQMPEEYRGKTSVLKEAYETFEVSTASFYTEAVLPLYADTEQASGVTKK